MKLAKREKEVYEYLMQGYGIKEIAKKMNLSAITVSNYRTAIYEKAQVHNIQELCALEITNLRMQVVKLKKELKQIETSIIY